MLVPARVESIIPADEGYMQIKTGKKDNQETFVSHKAKIVAINEDTVTVSTNEEDETKTLEVSKNDILRLNQP